MPALKIENLGKPIKRFTAVICGKTDAEAGRASGNGGVADGRNEKTSSLKHGRGGKCSFVRAENFWDDGGAAGRELGDVLAELIKSSEVRAAWASAGGGAVE
jgi:hypothetical protein